MLNFKQEGTERAHMGNRGESPISPKIIALYLPQYHEIEENNIWWGKGHTEWVSCKKAVPYFLDQYQPKVPLGKNYYNLLDTKIQREQAALANKYGISGLCYYHYWFNGKLLLEKPAENMLLDKAVEVPFCFSWANHSWINKVLRLNQKVLMKQTYGDEDEWAAHFNYLLPFFQDERYIKVNNKPMFVIYDAPDISRIKERMDFWRKLAIDAGFDGIYFVCTLKTQLDVRFAAEKSFDAQFEYMPTYALSRAPGEFYVTWYDWKRRIYNLFMKWPSRFSYDLVWKNALRRTPRNGVSTFLGAFTDWDITARWGRQGLCYKGGTPEKFGKFLSKQIARSREMNSDYIFITAWNEWSEGAYLEPDEKHRYAYLEQVKKALHGGN